jgi:hypothetical protein
VLSNIDRLRAVVESGLMDTPRRAELDALTAEAASRLHAPMALISVLDDSRLVIASSYGPAAGQAVHRVRSAQHSYCKYVVARDASADDRRVREMSRRARARRAVVASCCMSIGSTGPR